MAPVSYVTAKGTGNWAPVIRCWPTIAPPVPPALWSTSVTTATAAA